MGLDTDPDGDHPAEEVTDPEESHLAVDPSLPVDPFEGTLTNYGFAGCVSSTCGVGAEPVGKSCDVTTAEAGLAVGGRKAKPFLSWISPPSKRASSDHHRWDASRSPVFGDSVQEKTHGKTPVTDMSDSHELFQENPTRYQALTCPRCHSGDS